MSEDMTKDLKECYLLTFPDQQAQSYILSHEALDYEGNILLRSENISTDSLLESFAVGTEFICTKSHKKLLSIKEIQFFPKQGAFVLGYHVESTAMPAGTYAAYVQKPTFQAAIITLSDKASLGKRTDESGPLIAELLKEQIPGVSIKNFILADNLFMFRALVANLAMQQGYDMIISTGGTGLSPRDTSPEAVQPLFTKELQGFTHAMMALSLSKTPQAVLSRAVAGVINRCLVLTLPGSKKAARENLSAVLPALKHTLLKLNGDQQDCAIEK